MRQIKFRAWDKKKSNMVHDGKCDEWSDEFGDDDYTRLHIHFDGSITGHISDDGGKNGFWEHDAFIEKDRFILMQFTGLHDKNGKEIYEGDIVRTVYDSRHIREGHRREEIAIVQWDTCNPCFVMQGIKNKNFLEYDFIVCGMRTQEVIGNIYENPELLKETV